ncbi:hypothetical protein KIN20_015134 [Parelaphostrongylus tenuis]|uniref:Uncharacterized protein n=1 Tax=Parelaphostrongylus tenuis TaxID=148309 RepID=A0AAD5MZU0_PARTN|nr:hypothetical protein KIN20_015134 [Parelaphostrongylus tenuis]
MLTHRALEQPITRIVGGMIDVAEHENLMHVAIKQVYDFEEAIRKLGNYSEMLSWQELCDLLGRRTAKIIL